MSDSKTKNGELVFKCTSAKLISNFLDKISKVTNEMILEIDTENQSMKGITYKSDKSCVKVCSTSFEDIGIEVEKGGDTQPIDVCIFNLKKLIKNIMVFNAGEFKMKFKYIDYKNIKNYHISNQSGFVGITRIALEGEIYDKVAKLKLRFGDPKLFLRLDNKTISAVFGLPSECSFSLNPEQLAKITQLMQFDTESNPVLTFKTDTETNSLIVGNFTFDYSICTFTSPVEEINVNIIHNLMDCVDKSESYTVDITEDRLIFKSLDTDTTLTLLYNQ